MSTITKKKARAKKSEELKLVKFSKKDAGNIGQYLGSSISLLALLLSHTVMDLNQPWSKEMLVINIAAGLLSIGGLCYSFPTVYNLVYYAKNSKLMAVGFTLLMELGMVAIRPEFTPTYSAKWIACQLVTLLCACVVIPVNAYAMRVTFLNKFADKK